jgi:flagellar motor switch protein FliN/FliY
VTAVPDPLTESTAMSDDLQLQTFDPAAAPMLLSAGGDLERLTDVTVELAVEVGRTYMTLGEALALGPGSVVTLERLADKPVDLLINGRPIARGEVVVIDEQFGLRLTEVIGAVPSAPPVPSEVSPDPVAGDFA